MADQTRTGEQPRAVLFACGQNAVRSPMAAALMRHFFGHRIYVASAGVTAGETNPLAVEAMAELGIDIAQHMPQTFDDLYDASFDLVVSLTPEAHHRAIEMTRTMAIAAEYWPTADPTLATGSREQRLAAFRQVRDELARRLLDRFGQAAPPNA